MNTKFRIALILVILLSLALPMTVQAKDRLEDKIIFGGTYTLKSGEVLLGSLVVFGGSVVLEEGSGVTGDVVVLGGNLEANGRIDGSLVGIGGNLNLGESALVNQDVVVFGANLDRASGARVGGEVINGFSGPIYSEFPRGINLPRFDIRVNPAVQFAWFVLKVFLWAVLAVLLVLFFPRQIDQIGNTAINQVFIAGGLGLLTAIIAPIVLILLLITLICSPLSLLGFVVLAVSWGVGLIALGLEVGKRIAEMLKQEWAPALSAGVGTLILIGVLNGLRAVVPCVGWVFPALAGSVGLGAVMLTRFGTHAYPDTFSPASAPPPAPPTSWAPTKPEPIPSPEASVLPELPVEETGGGEAMGETDQEISSSS